VSTVPITGCPARAVAARQGRTKDERPRIKDAAPETHPITRSSLILDPWSFVSLRDRPDRRALALGVGARGAGEEGARHRHHQPEDRALEYQEREYLRVGEGGVQEAHAPAAELAGDTG